MLCLASSENLGPLAIHGLAWPPVNPTHNPPRAFTISGAKEMRLQKEAERCPYIRGHGLGKVLGGAPAHLLEKWPPIFNSTLQTGRGRPYPAR
jgi:hypothetical protein